MASAPALEYAIALFSASLVPLLQIKLSTLAITKKSLFVLDLHATLIFLQKFLMLSCLVSD